MNYLCYILYSILLIKSPTNGADINNLEQLFENYQQYDFAKLIRDNVVIDQDAVKQLQQKWQPFINKAKEIDYEATWNALGDFSIIDFFDENAVEKYGKESYYLMKGVVHDILKSHATAFSNLFSSPCKNDMYEYLMVFVNWDFTTGPNNEFDEWAVRMLDSSGKMETGQLTKRKKHVFGDVGQCLDARHHDGQMVGQYCTVLYTPIKKAGDGDGERLFTVQSQSRGFCVPSTCSRSELSKVLQKHWSSNTTDVVIPPGGCITSESPSLWNPQTNSVLFYLWVLLMAIGLSTGVHWWRLSTNEKKSTSWIWSVVDCFSVLDSWHSLFSDDDDDHLHILHGLRALSFIHIAFIIEFLSFLIRPAYNLYYLTQFMNSWKSLMWMQSVPIDTLFFCTSCKLAYQYQQYQRHHIPYKLLIRWFGVVGFTLVVVSPFIPASGNGHWAFYSNVIGYANCRSLFWNKMLFIDNWTGQSHKCLPHLTYLSVAAQLLLFTPFLLYLASKRGKAFIIAITTIATASIIATFAKVKLNNLPPSMFAEGRVDFYETIQVCTLTRAVPWLAGLWLGTKLAQDKTSNIQVNLNKNEVLVRWLGGAILGTSALMWVRLFQFELEGSYVTYTTQSAFYVALHSLPWVAALSILTYLTAHGYGGIVSSILGWTGFRVVGKLSTNALVVYYVWRLIRNAFHRDIAFLSYFYMWNDFVANTVVSLLGSVILYLLIDGPLIKLSHFIFTKKQTKPTKKLIRKKLN